MSSIANSNVKVAKTLQKLTDCINNLNGKLKK